MVNHNLQAVFFDMLFHIKFWLNHASVHGPALQDPDKIQV